MSRVYCVLSRAYFIMCNTHNTIRNTHDSLRFSQNVETHEIFRLRGFNFFLKTIKLENKKICSCMIRK
jgi:hypothetical protein